MIGINKVLSISFTYGEIKIFREVDGYSWKLPPSLALKSSQGIIVRHISGINSFFEASIIKHFTVTEDLCILTEVEILEAAENFTDDYGNIEQKSLVDFALQIEYLSQIKRKSQ